MTAPNPRIAPEIPNLTSLRRVHIIGLCGTAMGTLGAMLRDRGYTVSGSDAMAYPPMSTWLEARGMVIRSGYASDHIPGDTQLVIVGNVARRDNPEVLESARRALPCVSLPEALRLLFLAGRRPLVVTGTHGKTTTTAMATSLLNAAGADPSMFVGGVTVEFDASYRLGGGSDFVVEGDEYDTAWFDKVPKFWHYPPFAATVNNIEFDHADIYSDIGEIEHVFAQFAQNVDPRGQLWVNGDDERALKVTEDAWADRFTFGFGPRCDLRAVVEDIGPDGIRVRVHDAGRDVGTALLPTCGIHNVRNFLGAAGLVRAAGVPIERSMQAIAHYPGVRRRQERVGEAAGVVVYDDFAHHPTAVRETLAAIAARHPGQRLVVAFEAKSNTSRRAVFQDDYPPAFAPASHVAVAAAWKKDDLRPEQLLNIDRMVADIGANGPHALLIPEVDDIAAWAVDVLRPGDVFVALSGSAFGDLPRKVFAALQRR